MTSCLIVEDHDLMAVGITEAATASGLNPIRRATNLAEAFVGRPADVVLLDLSLPDSCRLDTVGAAMGRWPLARILVLSADIDIDHSVMLLRSGVLGVVGKDATLRDLSVHIKAVANYRFAITFATASALSRLTDLPEKLVAIFSTMNEHIDLYEAAQTLSIDVVEASECMREALASPAIPDLTRAQLKILVLVEAGLSNKVVASTLGVKIKTVERHLRDIRQRMGLPEREARQLGAFAQRLHRGCLLTLDEHLT
jgi:DNA-binding NarL/FixJ family response regulator